jgi:hypothetical protein
MTWTGRARTTGEVFGVALGLAALLAGGAGGKVADDEVAAWADARVKEWQPKPEERRFDEIGWAKDIRTALKLAKEHGRPVFLFTMDGRINLGRC